MSVVTIQSATLLGVEAHRIDVEVSILSSLPGLKMVGLPDATLREGRERVLLALKNAALLEARPSAVVNLAPAGIRKSGAAFELPMALGILVGKERVPREAVEGLVVVGELSLHGGVRAVRGALAFAALARTSGARALVVPRANAREAGLVTGLAVHGVETLRELVEWLRGEGVLQALEPEGPAPAARARLDFADVHGQFEARRAAEVAAAGGHNLILVGPPGSGKTMIARRIPGILPPLGADEALEATRVASVAGLLPAGAGLLTERPFRAPHHTISSAGLVGGYVPPRPGEVSLAHNGVLFLDELAELSRMSLEALREPLEEGRIRVSRGGVTATFPSRVLLVAATNPCPCGYLGDPLRSCACSQAAIATYRRHLSGPLLDRIDLHVEVPRLKLEEMLALGSAEKSATLAARVLTARSTQSERQPATGAPTNATLPERAIRDLVRLDRASERAIGSAVTKLGLSARAYVRVLRVSRTIADLEGARDVALPHVLEALQYRALDRRLS